MTIKDRLIKIISSEGLTSSAFADAIGVQRSSISHILSGRNKPSLDFLEKIMTSFPKYNAEWLIMGQGEVYKIPKQTDLFDKSQELNSSSDTGNKSVITVVNTDNEAVKIQHNETHKNFLGIMNDETQVPYQTKEQTNTQTEPDSNLKIEKIVILYTDNTFKEYRPK